MTQQDQDFLLTLAALWRESAERMKENGIYAGTLELCASQLEERIRLIARSAERASLTSSSTEGDSTPGA